MAILARTEQTAQKARPLHPAAMALWDTLFQLVVMEATETLETVAAEVEVEEGAAEQLIVIPTEAAAAGAEQEVVGELARREVSRAAVPSQFSFSPQMHIWSPANLSPVLAAKEEMVVREAGAVFMEREVPEVRMAVPANKTMEAMAAREEMVAMVVEVDTVAAAWEVPQLQSSKLAHPTRNSVSLPLVWELAGLVEVLLEIRATMGRFQTCILNRRRTCTCKLRCFHSLKNLQKAHCRHTPRRNPLIYCGAGEGNRTLVKIHGKKWWKILVNLASGVSVDANRLCSIIVFCRTWQ